MFKILIVEDNNINQLVLKTFLQNNGISVIVANNGLEAIHHYDVHKFDCILMDIAMPEMDGIAATQSIRKIEKNQNIHTPIIAVTASDPISNRDRYINAGIDEVVAKPFNKEELKSKIIKFSTVRFD